MVVRKRPARTMVRKRPARSTKGLFKGGPSGVRAPGAPSSYTVCRDALKLEKEARKLLEDKLLEETKKLKNELDGNKVELEKEKGERKKVENELDEKKVELEKEKGEREKVEKLLELREAALAKYKRVCSNPFKTK